MQKKSIAYLIMSLTIVGIVVANALVFSNRFKSLESSSIELVNNEFTGSVISDISGEGLDRFMEIASKKAFSYLSDYISQGGNIENFSEAFDTLVLNGTINGTVQYKYPTLDNFLGVATNYYFVLGFRVAKPSIKSTFNHLGPWNVIVTSDISYNIIVPRSKFSWVIDTTKITMINILGFFDPDDGWRITNKWKYNRTYPSFLGRLEGESGASNYGVCRDCEGEDYGAWVMQCTDEVCGDGVDNDCDGDIDCADSECIGTPICCVAEVCNDEIDNDCDGEVDCEDIDCILACVNCLSLNEYLLGTDFAAGTLSTFTSFYERLGYGTLGTIGYIYDTNVPGTVPLDRYEYTTFGFMDSVVSTYQLPTSHVKKEGVGYVYDVMPPLGALPLDLYSDRYADFRAYTFPSDGHSFIESLGFIFEDEASCVASLALLACKPRGLEADNCGDGVDNDCDGLFDCDDIDCALPCANCLSLNEYLLGTDFAAGTASTFTSFYEPLRYIYQETIGYIYDTNVPGTVPLDRYEYTTFGFMDSVVSTYQLPTSHVKKEGVGYVYDVMPPPGTIPLDLYSDRYADFRAYTFPSDGHSFIESLGFIFEDEESCVASLALLACIPTGLEADNCNDGVDNDCDGLFDCDDPDCSGDPACICVPLCRYSIPIWREYMNLGVSAPPECGLGPAVFPYTDFEAIEGYVFPVQQPGTIPLCRYSPQAVEDYMNLGVSAPSGCAYDPAMYPYTDFEAIEGYVFPAQLPGTIPLCRYRSSAEDYVNLGVSAPPECGIGHTVFPYNNFEAIEGYVFPDKASCCIPFPEVCDDGIDNDCDGLIDCDNRDCALDPACAITITTCEELQAIKDNLAGDYILGGDIDCSATNPAVGGSIWGAEGFEPIGVSSANSFTGYFDGLGHTITELYINGPAQDYVGLFGYVLGAEIRNVGLENVYITGTEGYAPSVGSLVGYSNRGSITNAYATGSVTEAGTYGYAGGLVGYNDGTITNSYATRSSVTGNGYAGGLVGNNSGSITNSYATGSATGDLAGGLVGKNGGSITNSYATGSVSGYSVGGLVAHNSGSITNSYATGNVDGSLSAGGLVSSNVGSITNSYATGSVTGDIRTWVGGLASSNYDSGTCSNSFWDIQTSWQTSSACGIGELTLELRQQSTFTDWGWDFVNIWNINEGVSYPYLIWEED